MLRPGVTQEWVGEGELPRERTKNQRWWRSYEVLAEATLGEVVVRVHPTRISAGDLDYFNAHIRLREPGKSEDKAECKATDSRTMGLAAPWYRGGRTSMESSIPCSHGGRALVVKGAEEVENAKANSKYQDRAEG
ncbi:hypothetical protein GW17_00054051 [Ensete ventricosum]|nr:hypothetical protein GW17_00054051 [Ensete ventricosum]